MFDPAPYLTSLRGPTLRELLWLVPAFFLWVGLADAAGIYASRLGRGRFYWFCVGLILSPIVAWGYLLAFGRAELIDCPFCVEPIREEAVRCPHCQSSLEEDAESAPRWWKERRRAAVNRSRD